MDRRSYLAIGATLLAGCSDTSPSETDTSPSGTDTGTKTATPSRTPSPTATPMPRTAFSTQLSNELEEDGPNGFAVNYEQSGLAFVEYTANEDTAEQYQEAVRAAYTRVVESNDGVGRDLEGRVNSESDGTRWYTFQVKEEWAQSYLAGDLSESEYRSRVESSRSES